MIADEIAGFAQINRLRDSGEEKQSLDIVFGEEATLAHRCHCLGVIRLVRPELVRQRADLLRRLFLPETCDAFSEMLERQCLPVLVVIQYPMESTLVSPEKGIPFILGRQGNLHDPEFFPLSEVEGRNLEERPDDLVRGNTSSRPDFVHDYVAVDDEPVRHGARGIHGIIPFYEAREFGPYQGRISFESVHVRKERFCIHGEIPKDGFEFIPMLEEIPCRGDVFIPTDGKAADRSLIFHVEQKVLER